MPKPCPNQRWSRKSGPTKADPFPALVLRIRRRAPWRRQRRGRLCRPRDPPGPSAPFRSGPTRPCCRSRREAASWIVAFCTPIRSPEGRPGDVDLDTLLGHELGRRLVVGVGEVDLLRRLPVIDSELTTRSYLPATRSAIIRSHGCWISLQDASIALQSALAISTSKPLSLPFLSTRLNGRILALNRDAQRLGGGQRRQRRKQRQGRSHSNDGSA